MTTKRPLRLHHVGLIVPDLDTATEWMRRALGWEVVLSEPETDVDPVQIGLPGESRVRIRGALLAGGGSCFIEIHQPILPPPREGRRCGPGHVAFESEDIDADMSWLTETCGMTWNVASAPLIPHGPYAGRRWAYGQTVNGPLEGTVIELFQDGAGA